MAIEVAIPKNLFKFKTKFIGNFSAREFICGVLGVSAALVGFFVLFKTMDQGLRIGLSGVIAVPFFLVGFLKIYDQPFEKMAYVVLYDNFFLPIKRPYERHYPDENPVQTKPAKVKPSRKFKGIK